MCLTCGCGDEDNVRVLALDDQAPGHRQHHDHDHEHGHEHALAEAQQLQRGPNSHSDAGSPAASEHARWHAMSTETLAIGEAILAKNDHLAQHNREWLAERGIVAFNLMSSPGSGKTSLLERTIAELGEEHPICVIEGDQETSFDAERIRRAGARAVQVNTGAGCHLDAPMVQRAIEALDPDPASLLFIENVGNLVCPALFDIGEQAKVVVISVTEGDDKPLKYPHMFSTAHLVIVNKTDLLPYVDFDLDAFTRQARSLNQAVQVLPLSVRTGSNVDSWLQWLLTSVAYPETLGAEPQHS
jgi:hydrogenase nickel incorporation protein HypB